MQIIGFVHTENAELRDSILRRLSQASRKRYGRSLTNLGSNRQGLIFSSNEVKTIIKESVLLAVSGYTTTDDARLLSTVEAQLTEHGFAQDAPVSIEDSLGGTHCIAAMSEFGNAIWGSLPGCSPPYYCQIDGAIVASNRPGILKATFNFSQDEDYVRQVLSIGYPIDDRSPYEGVRCILGGSGLRASRGRPSVVDYKLPEHGIVPDTEAEKDEADRLFQKEILRATSIVGNFKRIEFRLSGGKDSRLVASSLHKLGLQAQAHTGGSGEREIGRAVAKEIGVPFMNTIDTQPAAGPADIIDQCLRALRTSDAFIPFQGDKGLQVKNPIFPDQEAVLAGQIELHKGGYAKGRLRLSKEKAIERLEKYVLPSFMLERENASRVLAERFNYDQYKHPMDIVFFPYAGTRASRYLEFAYLRWSYKFKTIFPPNDERVYLAVSNLDRVRRASEQTLYNTTRANSPNLVRIPLFGDKYKCDHPEPDLIPKDEAPLRRRGARDQPSPAGPTSRSGLKFMREYVASSDMNDLVRETISNEMYSLVGINSARPSRGKQKENKRTVAMAQKVLVRSFMFAIAKENWEAI